MKLPQKKKIGDPILASDWNLLIDAITARTPRSGIGLNFTATAGGFSYSAPPATTQSDAGQPPFSVIAIEKYGEGGYYKLTLKEGWLIERVTDTYGVTSVVFHMPAYASVALDTTPRPQIVMTFGETLWCKYVLTGGSIASPPELIVSANTPADSTGTSHVKLIKLEDDDGNPAIKVFQQSDIELSAPASPGPGGLTGHVLIAIYPAMTDPPWQGPSMPPAAICKWFKYVDGHLVATEQTYVTWSNPDGWADRVVPDGYGPEIRKVIIPTDTGSMWDF